MPEYCEMGPHPAGLNPRWGASPAQYEFAIEVIATINLLYT
jgi:hypothetical protein